MSIQDRVVPLTVSIHHRVVLIVSIHPSQRSYWQCPSAWYFLRFDHSNNPNSSSFIVPGRVRFVLVSSGRTVVSTEGTVVSVADREGRKAACRPANNACNHGRNGEVVWSGRGPRVLQLCAVPASCRAQNRWDTADAYPLQQLSPSFTLTCHLAMSHCLCLSVCLSVCLSLSLSLSLSLPPRLIGYLAFYLRLFVCLCLSVCLPACLSVSSRLTGYLAVYLCLSVSFLFACSSLFSHSSFLTQALFSFLSAVLLFKNLRPPLPICSQVISFLFPIVSSSSSSLRLYSFSSTLFLFLLLHPPPPPTTTFSPLLVSVLSAACTCPQL